MSVWSPMDGDDHDDWGLQAIVRGCRFTKKAAAAADPFSSLPKQEAAEEEEEEETEDLAAFFPDLPLTQTALYELEELCKPFFPKPQLQKKPQQLILSPRRSNPSSPSSAGAGAAVDSAVGVSRQIPRSKRRKNQQKRVVCHVPADGISSDMWAWRKYGQKPIKGSPYPRGYYRCSSSKNCLARKQVERSRTDPGMLVITYTAEHNHAVPTHRNSLAGSTRHKFPNPASSAAGGGVNGEQLPPSGNPSSSPPPLYDLAGLSPNTPLTASMEDELLRLRRRRQPRKGEEGEEKEEEGGEEEEEDGVLLVEDMEMMGEDDLLFMGLDEMGGSPTGSPSAAAEATVSSAAAEATVSSAFLEDDIGFEEHFFPAAGGS